MSDDDFERLKEHLEDKWKNRACPLCGVDDWLVDTVGVVPLPFAPEARAAFPVFMSAASHVSVTCSSCGNTVLVSLRVVGLGRFKADAKSDTSR